GRASARLRCAGPSAQPASYLRHDARNRAGAHPLSDAASGLPAPLARLAFGPSTPAYRPCLARQWADGARSPADTAGITPASLPGQCRQPDQPAAWRTRGSGGGGATPPETPGP